MEFGQADRQRKSRPAVCAGGCGNSGSDRGGEVGVSLGRGSGQSPRPSLHAQSAEQGLQTRERSLHFGIESRLPRRGVEGLDLLLDVFWLDRLIVLELETLERDALVRIEKAKLFLRG